MCILRVAAQVISQIFAELHRNPFTAVKLRGILQVHVQVRRTRSSRVAGTRQFLTRRYSLSRFDQDSTRLQVAHEQVLSYPHLINFPSRTTLNYCNFPIEWQAKQVLLGLPSYEDGYTLYADCEMSTFV